MTPEPIMIEGFGALGAVPPKYVPANDNRPLVGAPAAAAGIATIDGTFDAELATTTFGEMPAPTHRKRLVILESPYAGDVEANVDYARRCLRDSLMRGESPIASHLLYTQPGVLDDDLPEERILGIDSGLAWRAVADASVVYVDRGISGGMRYGINAALGSGKLVEYRSLGAA